LSTNEDLGILTSFLDDLKTILESFMNDYIEDAINGEFKDAKLIPIFASSFPAARRALVVSINRLNEPDEGLLRNLDDHGLRGQSLILKMEIVNVHKKPLLGQIKTGKKSTLSYFKNRILRFFKAADIPLESLADCVPGLGLAVEFKKAVEHVIE
jgi:hypothetical protein